MHVLTVSARPLLGGGGGAGLRTRLHHLYHKIIGKSMYLASLQICSKGEI